MFSFKIKKEENAWSSTTFSCFSKIVLKYGIVLYYIRFPRFFFGYNL